MLQNYFSCNIKEGKTNQEIYDLRDDKEFLKTTRI